MDRQIAVIGLGYVGLPLAAEFAKHFEVLGFDISEKRISELKQGKDSCNEVSSEDISKIKLTNNPASLKKANFLIITVPTPVTSSKQPDLSFVESASKTVGENLSKGSIVVYESTVYPGVTEDICVPILEKSSNLKCGLDFKVGYSPERVNPGDKGHTIDKIVKIVSGTDDETCNEIASVYAKVCRAGIHKAPNIKTAEAAKVIENVQRDLNIALMNELSIVFDKMGLSTKEVLDAAATKWNFHKYHPGLVSGHCIPTDPYYLTYKALELGYHPHVILAGREINDNMYKHVAELVIRGLNSAGKVLKNSKVLVLGMTFKENVPDTRNSKAKDVVKELKKYGISVLGCDPLLSAENIESNFGVKSVTLSELKDGIDCVLLIAPHKAFKELTLVKLKNMMSEKPVLIDIKNFFNRDEALEIGFLYEGL